MFDGCQRVSADQPFGQAFVAQVCRASFFVISACAAVYQGNVLRVPRIQESIFDGNGYFFSPPGQSLRTGAHGCAILDQHGRLLGGDDF